MRRALVFLLLAACPSPPAPSPDGGTGDAGMMTDAGSPDAGPGDAGLPPYDRQLVQRTLMPTSPLNLLRDPFVGDQGSTGYGQFRAFFVNGSSLPLTRTFRSVSPVGGAVAVEELRALPPDAGTSTTIRVMSSFLGGLGNYQGSIWVSAGDVTAAPVPFAQTGAAIAVKLIDNDGTTQSTLTAGAPRQFGTREWVQFTSPNPIPMPHGGWLMLTLTDFSLTLQLAAPEVTSSAVAQPHLVMAGQPTTGEDRAAVLQARSLDEPMRDHLEPQDGR
jgi:hypothetical protein